MHVNFEVPLTARVLRAMLADMECTTGGCGCHQQHAPLTDEPNRISPSELKELVTSGIVEPGNPFAVKYPTPKCSEGSVGMNGVQVGADVLGVPFMLTPDGPIAVNPGDVTDPFVLQVAVPPVPTPPVAVTPLITPAPPCPPTGVKVDGEGLPWDQRIHASTKTFRQSDNTWKLRKGADAAEVERVKAELRACMAAPAPVTPALPVEPQNYSGAQSGGYTPVVPAPPVTAPVAPAPPVAVTPPAPTGQITFTDFCTWFTGKMAAKELSRAQLEQCCADNGITSLPMLQNRPDLVPVIHKFLASICMPASSIGGE